MLSTSTPILLELANILQARGRGEILLNYAAFKADWILCSVAFFFKHFLFLSWPSRFLISGLITLGLF